MEDVLEVYTRPYDPAHPVVCLDEISKQLVADTRTPLPAEPGQPERVDDESVPDLRTPGRAPPRHGHRAAHRGRFRQGGARPPGGPLSAGGAGSPGDGQPQHSQTRCAV